MRVLVIAESSDHAGILCQGLLLAGHETAEVTAPDCALPPTMARTRPDAVLLQTRSPAIDLLDRIIDAMGESQLPLIIFSADSSEETISRAVRAGASSYVVNGIEAERVPAILNVARARFAVINELRDALGVAQQKLAERKFVERAKGLLMKARGLSEDEAYHALRRMAMERNRRMGEVARSVIEMAELLN